MSVYPSLSRTAAPWQSPRVAAKKVVQAGDPEVSESALAEVVKRYWAVTLAVFAIAGGYYDLKSDLKVQANDIAALKKWNADPGKFPAGKGTAPPVPSLNANIPAPSASSIIAMPAESSGSPAASASAPMAGPKSIPSSAPAVTPPVCVVSKTFVPMDCTLAAANSCHDSRAFAPAFYESIKKRARVMGDVLVCDPQKKVQ